jgi:3-oxosteroid 1-dehydrogenase
MAEESWDADVDLVVLGSGSAALTGALVAALEGASVLVLEKAGVVGGTTAVSGGGLWIANNRHMQEEGVEDSRDDALAYLRACTGVNGEEEILLALLDEGPPMVKYLEDQGGLRFRAWPGIGGATDYRPWLPGSRPGARTLTSPRFTVSDLGDWAPKVRRGLSSAWTMDPLDYYRRRVHVMPPSSDTPKRMSDPNAMPEYFASGAALISQLLKACLEQGVTVLTGTPGEELLLSDGAVIGVRGRREGKPYAARARRGVLVATGGFGRNEALKQLWMSRPLEYTCDVESNQGDGHLMGMAAGAMIAGVDDAWWMPHTYVGTGPDGEELSAGSREDRILPHTMIVNQRGERFFNEAVNYYDTGDVFGAKEGGGPRNNPAWFLFDRQALERYALIAYKVPDGEPPEHLTVAGSVEELAGVADAHLRTLQRLRAQRRRRGLPPRGRRVGPALGRSGADAQPDAGHARAGAVLRAADPRGRAGHARRPARQPPRAGALRAARQGPDPRSLRGRQQLQRGPRDELSGPRRDDRRRDDVRLHRRPPRRPGARRGGARGGSGGMSHMPQPPLTAMRAPVT